MRNLIVFVAAASLIVGCGDESDGEGTGGAGAVAAGGQGGAGAAGGAGGAGGAGAVGGEGGAGAAGGAGGAGGAGAAGGSGGEGGAGAAGGAGGAGAAGGAGGAGGTGGTGGEGGAGAAGGAGGAGGDPMTAECGSPADCPQSEVPRCSATCEAGSCGTTCDTSVPPNGPECPADANDPAHCAAACSFFALCAIEQCDPLSDDSYIPLYEGCVEAQCGQAPLICIQNACGVLIGLARGIDMEFQDVCTNGPPAE